jgi:hypothetical protein
MNGFSFVHAPRCESCCAPLVEVETFMPMPDLRLGVCATCDKLYVVEASFAGGKFARWEMMEWGVFQIALTLKLIPVTSYCDNRWSH